jgi:F-type H+-transporting ATPase subunit b
LDAIVNLISWPIVISSAIGFIIFFLVLKRFMWKPVLDVIDERRSSIEAAFQEVDDARAEVERLKADYQAHLEQINAEAQAKLQDAIAKGQELAAQLRSDAEAQREKLLARTHEDIAREKDKALAELRNQAIDLSYEISRRVTKQQLDRGKHDQLVASFIDELKELN